MTGTAVAIIGMSLWAPGACELREFWENTLARRRQFREFPDCRMPLDDYRQDGAGPDTTYADRAALLTDFTFDWAARRIPEKTFRSTDIAQWIALEVALRALSDAGYSRETVPTQRSAALMGNSLTGDHTRSWAMRLRWPYVRRALRAAAQSRKLPESLIAELEETMEDYFKSPFAVPSEDTLAGVLSNTIAGRICNYLDFHGGGFVVDGACASGLLAVTTAAKALVSGEIDFALAGGVDVSLDPMELVGFARLGALTTGDMTIYDDRASGFIPGEGCGVVAMKRLDDARRDGDYVYATIRGWGISSDGKGGITQPHAATQALMIRRAYECAGVAPDSLSFVEGHGTATPVGDPAELHGIQLAVDPESRLARRAVGVTSLKALLGHTKAASGILALIKTAMAVNRRVLPPLAGCDSPSKVFRETATALFPIVQGEQRDADAVIRAGVQAMGFGGINCHVVVESADPPSVKLETALDERTLMASFQDSEVFVLTASSFQELLSRVEDVETRCAGASVAELVDLAAALAEEVDPAAPLRAAVVAGRPGQLRDRLRELVRSVAATPPTPGEFRSPTREVMIGHGVRQRVGFLFPGQGAQQLGMARTIVERCAWARDLVARADEWLVACGSRPVGALIRRDATRARDADEVREWEAALAQTDVTQPAVALASLLWVKYLRQVGLTPSLVAGHSLGELVALYAAGAYDERTLIELAAAKGRAMANPSGKPGAMASLGCDYARAREFVADIPGLEIANVNAPDQVVVAGTREAIGAVIRRAREHRVTGTRLRVSNAFHSSLMTRARDQLRESAPLSADVVTLDTPCYSCVSGELLESPCDARTLVADQVVSRVNWIELVRTASRACDYFLEVGPGRVLTGLVNAINGPDGTPCLPVASRPEADSDLSIAMATSFTRGAGMDWTAFYADRLVRPFVAASDRAFIENPVEKPFTPSIEYPPSTYTNGNTGSAADALREYLENRGQFLVDVIRADIATTAGSHRDARPVPSVLPSSRKEGEDPDQPAVDPSAAVGSARSPEASGNGREPVPIEDRLIEALAHMTGYERQSIDRGLRLLDDLNLDSIKAAEVIGAVAAEYRLSTTIDPTELTNATITEIVDSMRAALPGVSGNDVRPAAEVTKVLFEVVCEATGFQIESLSPGLRLLDDLNLDSIKAATVVSGTCAKLGVGDAVDPSEFGGATLADIAAAIETAAAARPDRDTPADNLDEGDAGSSWVRSFVVAPTVTALNDEHVGQFTGKSVLVVADEKEADHSQALLELLIDLGADASIATFEDVDPTRAPHVVAVLPREITADKTADEVFRTVRRLRSVIAPVSPTDSSPASLTFVQFGGVLSLGGEYGSFACSSTDAFAASVHHERPGLKIRVLDFDRRLSPEAVANRVVDELRTATSYVCAGYDAEQVRRVPQARLVSGPDFDQRQVTLGHDDVVVVTGGGKGIMAECALALAAEHGVSTALVGTTPRGHSAEVDSTLQRFAERGLTAEYFPCDVTDRDAVRDMLSTVSAELGTVSVIVHGAGINRPRKVEQTDAAVGFAEIAPKIMGAVNLLHLSEDLPIKLFIGVSSVIGVTGMPGNAWYALGNQMLDSFVRESAEHRRDCAFASIAYSVWAETGMGSRMGSARQLARRGIGSIPTMEGVRHFLRLVDSCPGATRTVVTGSLGGLDTWCREGLKLPVGGRYLERIVRAEPDVELIAETTLSLVSDEYIRDHVWKGSALFPTVFGLEAMAQAVHGVTGHPLDRVRIENVRLHRPITVGDHTATPIRVEAQVCERLSGDDEVRVFASVRRPRSTDAEFSADFVLGRPDPAPSRDLSARGTPLDIDPVQHLYGGLLFQGPKYQRLRRIYCLDSRHCRFEAQLEDAPGKYLLGDPFFLDALLQSGQLVVPQEICLPMSIGVIELYPERLGTGIVDCLTYDKVTDGSHVNAKVMAVRDGHAVIELIDYCSRIVQRRPDNPTAEELASPGDRDKRLIEAAVADSAGALGITVPNVTIQRTPGIHTLGRGERHVREQPIFAEVIGKVTAQRGGES